MNAFGGLLPLNAIGVRDTPWTQGRSPLWGISSVPIRSVGTAIQGPTYSDGTRSHTRTRVLSMNPSEVYPTKDFLRQILNESSNKRGTKVLSVEILRD